MGEFKQIPTIGRGVIYTPTEEESNNSNQARKLPATIVSVHEGGSINIKVQLDGPSLDLWKPSCIQGDGVGEWNWPKIV